MAKCWSYHDVLHQASICTGHLLYCAPTCTCIHMSSVYMFAHISFCLLQQQVLSLVT
jgi:hypothetical protein